MKTITINYAGLWKPLNPKDNVFYNILSKRYNVIISDTPQYVFCSMLGIPYQHTKYDCVRIFFSGENYSPDFSSIDYAIGSDYISFEDRYFRFPLLFMFDQIDDANEKHIGIDEKVLKEKTHFCNFIYGDGNAQKYRMDLFHELCKYKNVDSSGTLLHNTGDFYTRNQITKLEFQKKCKFSIAVESTVYNGFVTEKIMHAFASKTVPIYFGDPTIERQFNPKSFINCNNFSSIDDVVEFVKEIDNNDELYLSMLKEPIFSQPNYLQDIRTSFEQYLYHIFDQDFEDSFRRPRTYISVQHEHHLQFINRLYDVKTFPKKVLNQIRGEGNR